MLAILLTGTVKGFDHAVERTVAEADADTWLVPKGTSGPFTSVRAMPQGAAGRVAKQDRVQTAHGMVISLQTLELVDGEIEQIIMLGAEVGQAAQVTPAQGDPVRTDGEAVVDLRLGVDIGDSIVLGGRQFTVVGLVEGMTMLGGVPDVWVSLPAAQAAVFRGQRLVTTVVVAGSVDPEPPGLRAMSNAQVEEDSLGPMADAVASINNTRSLMWAVAVIIVGALVYVSSLVALRRAVTVDPALAFGGGN